MTATRTATFCGTLRCEDYRFSDDLKSVAIDSTETDILANRPAWMVKYGPAIRSQRPYAMRSFRWREDIAGKDYEQVCKEMTAECLAEANETNLLPGADLEVWALPVVQFTFDFLLTPAGEWPQEGV